MNIIVMFLGVTIGSLGWSFLARFSYAIHDATNKTNLATKLSDPNGVALSRMLGWIAGASFIWFILFGGACWHFARSDSPNEFLAWFFGGLVTTPLFIAFTTARVLRRIRQHNAERAQSFRAMDLDQRGNGRFIDIRYQYLCDTAYFKAVIERQYQQGPWLLLLPVQFGLLGIGCAIGSIAAWGTSDPTAILLIVVVCFVVAVSGVWATKQALMMKFKGKQGFGTEALTLLTEDGVGVGNAEHHSIVAWSTYPDAIRFPDGILLKRPGSIRWLPDSGLTIGSAADATSFVASKTSLRFIR